MQPSAAIVATTSTAATFAAYMLGADRSYDYDSSVTVGNFIATSGLSETLTRQIVFNNHPLFSALEHLVYAAGGDSEVYLRVLPVLCASLTVGVIGYLAAVAGGAAAGIFAAAVLALNPMFQVTSREVRGYSLLTLCAVASSWMVVRQLNGRSPRLWIAYPLTAAAGIATHLYGVFVVAAQAATVIARRRLSIRWVVCWAAAGLLGASAYAGIARAMLNNQERQGSFQPLFPLELARELLGHHMLAVILLLPVAVTAAHVYRRQFAVGAFTVAALLTGVWLVVRPLYLYPRFLVWLVPAVAFGIGVVAARSRVAAAAVVAACAILLSEQAGTWSEHQLPLRATAALADDVRARGDRACAIGFVGEALAAYTQPPEPVYKTADLISCGFTFWIPEFSGPHEAALADAARKSFPRQHVLRGRVAIEVFHR